MTLSAEYIERLIAESHWLPTGITRVYIEPGIIVELNRTETGWIVSVRRRVEELPVSGTRNFIAPADVPDFFTTQGEKD